VQEAFKINLEDTEVRKKLILALVGFLLTLFVAVINHVAGLDPILNFIIVLLIFIVLGCTIAYVREEKIEIEAQEQADKDQALDQVRPYLEHVERTLDVLNAQLNEFQESIDRGAAHLPPSVQKNLTVIERIKERLDQRAMDLQDIIELGQTDKIDEARELGESPLTFPQDTVNSVVTDQPLPDLPSDQWQPTILSLLDCVRSELN
jgi:Ca2+/Na+ antiporter